MISLKLGLKLVWGDKDTLIIVCFDNRMNKPQQSILREREVQQLLKLQELFHSHYLTEEMLNDLIALYVRFAESAQGNNSLRLFFMEKIRFVLSRPEVLKGLERDRESGREPDRRIDDVKHHVVNGQRKKVGANPEMENKNDKIQHQMKVMRQVEEEMNAFRENMGRESAIRIKKQTQINQIVNQQDQALAERRANRKKKLRKKSVDFNEKEVIVETPAPIALAELKLVQKELNQTYERFTRLTQNKVKKQESNKVNKGRVRFQIPEQTYEEQQLLLDEPNNKPKENPQKSSKNQNQNASPSPVPPPRETTTVQYKPFDQKQGRVTMRKNQYEQIDQQQF